MCIHLSDRDLMDHGKYEVHFYHNFVQYHPWGKMPDKDSPCTLQVLQLCHATHNEWARKIDQGDGLYRFKPRPKCGKYGEKSYYYTKKWTQTPDMDTPSYQLIPQGEDVFPGYYSWWGLAVDPSYDPLLENPPKCLPPYQKTPPKSIYGGNAFQSSFPNLLQCYATSRDCKVQDVYLRMGGTLRYKCEIGYAVIICTSDDLGELNTYKPITVAPSDVFDPNGLVDEEGKIQDVACVPQFTTQHMNTYSSHEALNFAFYFPSPATEFRCHNIKRHQIKHNGKDGLCIYRVRKDGELRCPDYIDT